LSKLGALDAAALAYLLGLPGPFRSGEGLNSAVAQLAEQLKATPEVTGHG
jgi:hypothetical protein